MIHFGDICKMDGSKIPVVDIVTFGAPCQDISVAGKRKGMLNESRGDSETTRSGLFFEAIRVIKEMRKNDRRTGRTGWLIRPRFAVYENVPGAFSSNQGKDFQAVLSEIVKIAEPDAPDVPMPETGRWSKSGCLYSDLGNWSVAWRVHDAQFWGVPQRRKRIALVADFGGLAAPEILFEREGLSGDSEPCETEREGTAAGTEGGVGEPSFCLTGWDCQSKRIFEPEGICATLNSGNKEGGNITPSVIQRKLVIPIEGNGSRPSHRGNGYGDLCDPSFTLNSIERHSVSVFENHSQDSRYKPLGEVSETVNAKYGTGGNNQPLVVGSVLPFDTTQVTSEKNWSNPHYGDPCHPLAAQAHVPSIVSPSVVRRLTPLECERLQGYPSKKMVDVSQMTKDEYIAWNLAEGNIIADQERGKVYGTRGPGGCPYKEPKELKGSDVNGYKVVSIRNGATKLQCRVHRIIWISAHGIIPDGYVIDHINNDKMDNRLENLQLLTPEQNSKKAQADGLYKSGLDNKATKLDPDLKDEIAFLYEYSDLTMRNLAELYGVSKSRIAQIVHEVGWTDIGEWIDSKGKKHKEADSPRYKALGNSIALPFWAWMARRICAQYERPMTMGSLFDGIGGFPLVFERAGAKAVWASEIEEFPIAVTKKHFPEEVTNESN